MARFSIPSVPAHDLFDARSWWNDINSSPLWQDRIFLVLAAFFGFVSSVALIQLIRIECRVPEYGWTTQKVFHLLNFLVNGVRSIVFVFRRNVQQFRPEVCFTTGFFSGQLCNPKLKRRILKLMQLKSLINIFQHVLLDMPALVFFTTYALLALFWAEIHFQARGESTDGLRPTFYVINVVIYTIQIALWLLLWWKPIQVVLVSSKIFFAGVSLFAAFGFLLYGGRLFLMLQRFPVESKGRRKKLQEIGFVATTCFTCFAVRCVMICFNVFDKDADLDVLDHPILNLLYYLMVEILPSCLVLFILRKLPPKRGVTHYHPIH